MCRRQRMLVGIFSHHSLFLRYDLCVVCICLHQAIWLSRSWGFACISLWTLHRSFGIRDMCLCNKVYMNLWDMGPSSTLLLTQIHTLGNILSSLFNKYLPKMCLKCNLTCLQFWIYEFISKCLWLCSFSLPVSCKLCLIIIFTIY